MAKRVGDLEPLQSSDAPASFLPKWPKVRRVDLVLALDLLHHELGVGDDTQGEMTVVECPLETSEQAGVLGEVVGAVAQEFG